MRDEPGYTITLLTIGFAVGTVVGSKIRGRLEKWRAK